MRKLVQRLFILTILVSCLGVAVLPKAQPKAAVLPCCSVCDEHPEFCTHGCLEGC